ncbi:MAG TPA: hypothetical protein VGM10_24265 [Actinocrinis sp.]
MSEGPEPERTPPVPQDADAAVVEQGAPNDREFHLRRVAAVWPQTFSRRTLERLARLLGPGVD